MGFLGAGALLLSPPVQAWLLRRAMATQPGAGLDFSHVALGPGGAEATDIKLRLPNLIIEARALRLAISPWQLLSRRRLAIADLQAKQLTIRATGTGDAPATPFTGLLDGLQAPLAWACSKAEADGTLTLEQAGAAPVEATFAIKGTDLDITKPGRLEFEFSIPGALVSGFSGTWKFSGTLDFSATPDEHVDRIVIDGRLSPASHKDLALPEIQVHLTAARTATGESYEVAVSPKDHDATAFTGQATYARSGGQVTGTWLARGGSGLAAQVLKRSDLPTLETDTRGTFSLDPRTGAAQAGAEGKFSGTDWQRFMPELSTVGRLQGHHSIALVRRNGQWLLEKLDANAVSDGSAATVQLGLTRPVALPPGGDGNTTPWGRLSVKQLPLGWTAPLLGIARVEGGEMAGTWTLASPDAGTLRLTPLDPLHSTPFSVTDPTLPKLPAFSFTARAQVDLTAATALVQVGDAALFSDKGDRVEGRLESKVDLDQLIADTTARWHARLPTWLGPQGPVLHGEVTADVTENFANIRTFQLTVRHDNEDRTAFRLAALAPFKVDYEHDDPRVDAPEGDLVKFSAENLRLDWASSLLPGLSLSGQLASGESTLRREGAGFVVATGQPWRLQDLAIVQGGLTLLRAPAFSIVPEGRVTFDADWTPRDFIGGIKVSGELAEIFRLRDPAGNLSALGSLALNRLNGRLELRTLDFQARRHDDTPLLTLEALHPIVLGRTAKNNDIDQAAETLRLRTAAVPLAWLQPLLPAGTVLAGTLEPAEFAAKIDLPNAFLNPAKPVVLDVKRFDDITGPVLRDARVELSPALIIMDNIVAVAVENGRVILDGREAGTAGLSAMFLTYNLQIPVSANVDVQANIGLLRGQPVAATLPLPATGRARFLFSQDLLGGKDTTATLLLSEVQGPTDGEALPRLGARITQLKTPDKSIRIRLEFQYQTTPTWSAFTTEFDLGMEGRKAKINATLKGDYFNVGRFMDLVNACTPAVMPPAATSKPTPTAAPTPVAVAAATAVEKPEVPLAPFWERLASKWELEFGAIDYASYRVEKLTGEFEVNEQAVDLRRLSGKMFDGDWGGRLRLGFNREQPEMPYELGGGFDIKDFSAARIVQAAYPNELGSFDGRLNFSSKLSSRGTGFHSLFDDSTSEFTLNSVNGRLQLKVPHANLASAALLVGGAITFSPELRAIGRLVKQFSDLPVNELSARGRRVPGGDIFLDDLRLQTPQLRLTARGKVPAKDGVDLAARPFELPVTLAVKDDLAVLLKGMKLIGKQPGPDGYFTMTRQPTLRGTLGAPDTTELYDVFAQAVSGSSGTFGLLMKKVRTEVEKSQAKK